MGMNGWGVSREDSEVLWVLRGGGGSSSASTTQSILPTAIQKSSLSLTYPLI